MWASYENVILAVKDKKQPADPDLVEIISELCGNHNIVQKHVGKLNAWLNKGLKMNQRELVGTLRLCHKLKKSSANGQRCVLSVMKYVATHGLHTEPEVQAMRDYFDEALELFYAQAEQQLSLHTWFEAFREHCKLVLDVAKVDRVLKSISIVDGCQLADITSVGQLLKMKLSIANAAFC